MKQNQKLSTLYEVFIRAQSTIGHQHVGSLHATDAQEALLNARDLYTRRNEGISIWVVPSHLIIASDFADNESFFDPAKSKVYRHPTFFHVPDGVKNL